MARLHSTAALSNDRVYRWELCRWVPSLAPNTENMIGAPKTTERPLVVCGLNPSTADEKIDDPTIRREIDFAERWGCARLIKVNAYGFRTVSPDVLFERAREGVDIIGSENDAYIERAIALCKKLDGIFLVAWGTNIEPARQTQLAQMIGDCAMCIKTNKNGTPIHPLYQPKTSTPIPWRLP